MKIILLALKIIYQLEERLARGVLDWQGKANIGLEITPGVSQSKQCSLLIDSG